MALPVTGPFTKTFWVSGPETDLGYRPHWVSGSRSWYRQKKPFNLELGFGYQCSRILSARGGDGTDYVNSESHTSLVPFHDDYAQRLYNATYEKFVEKVTQERAQLASTLAQWKKSRDMIVDRATRLYEGYKAVKRGDIKRLKSLWGKGAGVRAYSKLQSGNILEASFGWIPLVKDISTAVERLADGIPLASVRVRKSTQYWVRDTADFGSVVQTTALNGRIECSMRGWIRVTNPNTLLYNQLGLTNPAADLWEIAPWSFIVDYFLNVQAFLLSFTDFLGIELERTSRTFFTLEKGSVTGSWDLPEHLKPDYNPLSHSWDNCVVNRLPGIVGPTLDLRLPWTMSMQRAITSIALLIQQMK